MKDVFENIKTSCVNCSEPIYGNNLNKIGDDYYCQACAEIKGNEEKLNNKLLEKQRKNFKKVFGNG